MPNPDVSNIFLVGYYWTTADKPYKLQLPLLSMANGNKAIVQELKQIKADLEYIKEHMVDADTILTEEEAKKLDQSLAEFKAKKTTSLDALKKELTNA